MKTHITTSIRRSILAVSILGLTAITSHAAVVTWGGATNIAGDSDVSTAGTLVGALNIGSGSNTTLNGVTFAGLNLSGSSTTSGNFNLATPASFSNGFTGSGSAPFSTLSAPYQALLANGGTTSGLGQPFTLTMSGLSVGATYQFQWWNNISAGPVAGSTIATAGNAVALAFNTSVAFGGLGQFAIGTFTADAAGQAITFTTSGNTIALNGLQLRQLAPAAVPEPGSALAGLLALGVCLGGLAGRRRERAMAESD